jgi:hypothetical protein
MVSPVTSSRIKYNLEDRRVKYSGYHNANAYPFNALVISSLTHKIEAGTYRIMVVQGKTQFSCVRNGDLLLSSNPTTRMRRDDEPENC